MNCCPKCFHPFERHKGQAPGQTEWRCWAGIPVTPEKKANYSPGQSFTGCPCTVEIIIEDE